MLMVTKCHPNNNNPNNNNLNNNNIITTNRKKSTVVAVNFKKLKEKRKLEDVENLNLSGSLRKIRKSYRIIELMQASFVILLSYSFSILLLKEPYL